MSCFNDKPIPRPQNPESDGRNPTDVTLDRIAQYFFLSFNEFKNLNETKKMIEEKYDIKKENGCWPDDYIKQAWRERQLLNKMEREEWAIAIILQIVKRNLVQSDLKEKLVRNYKELRLTDTPDQMKAEKENVGPKADDGLRSTDRPTERSYQSNAEQKTAGADEQLFGAGLKPSQCKLTEESGPADEKENKRWVDVRQSTVYIKQACGEAPKKKPNLLERLSQRNVMKTGGAAGGDEERSGAHPTTYGTETPVADPNMPPKISENMPIDETICIRIPLSMFFSEPTVEHQECEDVQSCYKLINGAPSNVVSWKKNKSYVVSFNNRTGNADWVYEILNKKTLANNCMQGTFGDPYEGGHLAAAANHRWCWEALNDSNLNCNIIPQHKILNRGPWGKLERYCRRLSNITGVHNVHVYSGPLYLRRMTDVPLRGKVVPSDFFKVIIVENEDGTVEEPECYMMPNDNPLHSDLEKYIVHIDFLEGESRMKFTDRRNVGERKIIVKATLQGQDVNSMIQNAKISVKFSPNWYL